MLFKLSWAASLFTLAVTLASVGVASVGAASVLIAAPQASLADFEVFAQLHPELIRFSQFQSENLPSPPAKQNLLELFMRAKERYFSEDQTAAKKIFEDILSQSTQESWMQEVRGLFFDSALYLAILETKKRATTTLDPGGHSLAARSDPVVRVAAGT